MIFVWKTFGIYSAIALGVFGVIGVSAATIGFTAWLLTVPLLFVGFQFNPSEAILVAACVDCANSLLILLLYAARWKLSASSSSPSPMYHSSNSGASLLSRYRPYIHALLLVGVPAVACCITCIFFSATILELVKDRLKSGIGYLLLVLGLLFVVKGVLAHRKRKKAVAGTAHHADTLVDVDEQQQQQQEEEEQPGESAPLIQAVAEKQHDDDNVVTIAQLLCQCAPRDAPLGTRIWAIGRVILGFFIMLISGCLSGFLGIGSGLNFVIIFLVVFRMEIKEATVCGCVMMFVLTVSVIVSIASGSLPGVDLVNLWPYLLVSVVISLLGVCLGFLISQKVSPVALNFLVAVCLLIGGTLATIEIILFSKSPPSGNFTFVV